MTAIPVYFPDSGLIQVHQSRACSNWPAGFYWYGKNRLRQGGVPRWLNRILSEGDSNGNGVRNASPENNDTPEASVDDQDDVEEDQETTTKDVEDTTTKDQDETNRPPQKINMIWKKIQFNGGTTSDVILEPLTDYLCTRFFRRE